MAVAQAELARVDLPEFGTPTVEPLIGREEYESRLRRVRDKSAERGLDALVVYGDREHSANLAYLTGYDPRFEESLLVIAGDAPPALLVGNEGWGYSQISQVRLERILYQPFSLMGQDRSRSRPLAEIIREAGVRAGTSLGVIDWKYSQGQDGATDRAWLCAPSYLVDLLRDVTGRSPQSATDLLMSPTDGLRATSGADQLACFEFAATHISSALHRVMLGLRPGLSEFEAMENARLNGLPLCLHPVLMAGPRAGTLGMASPTSRRMRVGDPFLGGLGVWGALSARAGFLAHDDHQLPEESRDYVDRLVKPYFAAIAEWYEHAGIGVKGGELWEIIHRRLGDPFYGISLNPGHLLHLDEWVHSPIYPGSEIQLRSGMALQVDVIPATGGPYFTTNVEDGIALADAPLREAMAARWPEAWSRIQARREFMRDKLGISLKPEVLPLSSLAGHLTPYVLDPTMAMRVAR